MSWGLQPVTVNPFRHREYSSVNDAQPPIESDNTYDEGPLRSRQVRLRGFGLAPMAQRHGLGTYRGLDRTANLDPFVKTLRRPT